MKPLPTPLAAPIQLAQARVHRRQVCAWLGLVDAWPAALAQPASAFPERAITLVVPFAPGGIADLTARVVAQGMAQSLGQPIVIDNKPSAGSIVASQAVAQARPDGHTLLLMSNGHAVSASLFKKLPYDTVRAFQPIATLASFELVILVAAGSRFANLGQALAHARSQPGKLSLGTIAVGSTQHLAAKLFESQAGIETLVVPYKGTPAVMTALRSGEIDIAFEILGPSLSQVQSGALRALAVTGPRRHPALPQVPTVVEAGVAAYEVSSWNALAAPAGTPPEVLARLQRAAQEALTSATVQERLAALGVHPEGAGAEQTAQTLAREIKRWAEVIRRAGIETQ